MIAALLASMLLVQSGPDVPEADAVEDQWVCAASAKGGRNARVDVSIQLTSDRDILARDTSWSPPVVGRAALSRPDVKAPGLTLFYEYAEAEEIGEVSAALGDASAVGAPAGTLDAMTWAIQIDGGDTWRIAMDAMDPESDDTPGEVKIGDAAFDFRSAWLGGYDSDIDLASELQPAQTVTLSLVDAGGHPVSKIRYDLKATAERDRLFAKAWKKAEKLALHPEQCTKASEDRS